MTITAPTTSRRSSHSSRPAVLTVQNLTVVYEVEHPVTAVRNATISLAPGEILGLAGESGCGKTTLAYAINRLHKPPARIASGTVTFHDRDGSDIDLLAIKSEELRAFRWSKLSMVFQGAIVELDTADHIYRSPQHPYTKKLLASFPSLSGSRGSFIRTGLETHTEQEPV